MVVCGGGKRKEAVGRRRQPLGSEGQIKEAFEKRGWRLFADNLDDGHLGGGLIDDGFILSEGGDESLDGEVIKGARETLGSLVKEGDGVVAEEVVFATGEIEVVADISGRFGQIHTFEVDAESDALVEGGEDALTEAAAESGLPDEEHGGGGAGVHVGVEEHTEILEVMGCHKVSFVNDENDAAAALGFSQSQGLSSLVKELKAVEERVAAQSDNQQGEKTDGAGGGIGEIDDLETRGFESSDGGPGGDSFAGPDLAGEDAQAALIDEPGKAGGGFLVGGGAKKRSGREFAAEGGAGEAVVIAETVNAHENFSLEVELSLGGGSPE
jgi:hypothetical protein